MAEVEHGEWRVSCLDAAGRTRELVVRVAGPGQVAVALPAGESATLDVDGCLDLLRAVGNAIGVMRSTGRGEAR